MNVLVACEESQRVCLAFRAKGHNAFSCDILPCSGGRPEYHIQGDVLPLLSEDVSFTTCDGVQHKIARWDMLIAFPPCTYLTKAGSCNIPRDPSRIEKGDRAREFFMKLYTCCIERIAIENPIPMKRFNLPLATCHFQPYYFGDPYTKYTYLWLKNLPPLSPTCEYDCAYKYPSWCKISESGIKDRSKIRSKTFQGVANAMAEQWG